MTTRHTLLLVLVAGVALGERRALVVTNKQGRIDQPALRYTANDGERVRLVMTELGGFEAPVSLQDQSRADTLSALAAYRNTKPFELFVFYYSGHGDAGGLFLGDSYLAIEDLMTAIKKVPAELRIIILDACQSGGATLQKGVALAAPVDVSVELFSAEGDVLIASSSAQAASFESETLAGAVFTLQWVSGLRGAADEDDDGRVSLSEAYRYASVRTLKATLLSPSGPQRPTFRWNFTGKTEPIMTRLGTASRLTLHTQSGGSFFIFDSAERQLLGELSLSPNQNGRVMLRQGQYVVRSRNEREVRSARVVLNAGDDKILNDSQMQGAPFVRLVQKGSVGQFALTASAGPIALALASMLMLQAKVGAELQRGWGLWNLEIDFLAGSKEAFDLTVTQRGLGIQFAFLPGLTFSRIKARLGPSLGVLGLEQRVTGRHEQSGLLLRGELRLRVELDVVPSLAVTFGAQAGGLLGRIDSLIGVSGTGGVNIGLRFEL